MNKRSIVGLIIILLIIFSVSAWLWHSQTLSNEISGKYSSEVVSSESESSRIYTLILSDKAPDSATFSVEVLTGKSPTALSGTWSVDAEGNVVVSLPEDTTSWGPHLMTFEAEADTLTLIQTEGKRDIRKGQDILFLKK
ncbi:MAG: hypothetical protein QG664_310 [Patescibacteria group bacterium]|nr:hypothetical protein [Patescibacteria group bacterium]